MGESTHRWTCLTCGESAPATSYAAGQLSGGQHSWWAHNRRGRRNAYIVEWA